MILAVVISLVWPWWVIAQEATPTPPAGVPTAQPVITATAQPTIPPTHIVQEGEFLVTIAEQYETTVEAILLLNGLTNPDALYIGQELLIPGATGSLVPLIYAVQIGDTLPDIAARFNSTPAEVAKLNYLVHPQALLAGEQLSLLSRTGSAAPQEVQGLPHVVQAGETMLTLAVRYNLPAGQIAQANSLPYPYRLYVGQRLRIPQEAIYSYLNDEWQKVEVKSLPLTPGGSLAVYVENSLPGTPTGRVLRPDGQTQEMTFIVYQTGFLAVVGLDSFAPAGVYTIELSGEGPARPWHPFSQKFVVQPGDYTQQNIVIDDPKLLPLLANEVRQEEDAYLAQIFTQFNPTKYWEGLFQYPVSTTIITARYGDARSYNGAPVTVFHTGVDFAGTIGTDIKAPANGVVAFVGTLNLRGQTLIIDHGLGVMTAYYHLSKINVAVGDAVTAGQIVAKGGNTGLSTGPHLHWDLRINNVAVNPLLWTQRTFP